MPGIDDNGRLAQREIWAVGGGKGGTGKTYLSASLAIGLARLGKRVIAIDADLGCANLHTALGAAPPAATLSDFIKGRVKSLHDVLGDTALPGLRLISGAHDFLEIANPKYTEKMRLIKQIQELDVDYIILDLGAGTAFNSLDFFLAADRGILTVIPEPTSIENVYRFIKSAFYRRFKRAVRHPDVKALVSCAMDQKNERGIRTPHDLIAGVEAIDPEVGGRLRKTMAEFSPKIVVNQVRSQDDATLGLSMRSSCSKYFGIQVEYLGYVEYDDSVWRAMKRRRPPVMEYPDSCSSRGAERVLANLLKGQQIAFDLSVRG
ncbi:MAG: ATP-binding protein [Nitrospirae bacterium RIFCSPHIGHO2_01_FULL_66_17]|nr:MAG: ATP-binding protein [Nitrospirae bacterium RIFCSPHIGHO2_01_FULL_66_17]